MFCHTLITFSDVLVRCKSLTQLKTMSEILILLLLTYRVYVHLFFRILHRVYYYYFCYFIALFILLLFIAVFYAFGVQSINLQSTNVLLLNLLMYQAIRRISQVYSFDLYLYRLYYFSYSFSFHMQVKIISQKQQKY